MGASLDLGKYKTCNRNFDVHLKRDCPEIWKGKLAMFKKFSPAVLATFLLLALFVPLGIAYAEPPGPPSGQGATHANAHARLRNRQTGEVIELPVGTRVEDDGQGGLIVTYDAAIPRSALGGGPNASARANILGEGNLFESDSHYGCDSTAGICATLTLTYVYSQYPNNWMYVTNDSVIWYRNDGSISWSGAYLEARCLANWWPGSGDGTPKCEKTGQITIGVPISGATYGYTPTWAGPSYKTYWDALQFHYVKQYIDLSRQSSHWAFEFCVAVGGWGIESGCW